MGNQETIIKYLLILWQDCPKLIRPNQTKHAILSLYVLKYNASQNSLHGKYFFEHCRSNCMLWYDFQNFRNVETLYWDDERDQSFIKGVYKEANL